MTQNANTFLQVRDLVVEYTSDGKVIHAVNGVNFDLERGKALALVGETGAGKTTIAKSIMRILPDPPAHVRSGQVVLQGRDLMKLNEADMRKVRGKEISMIFQDPMTALNPTMRIGDQIAEVIRLHDKVTKAESMQKAQKMLETVGITAERYGNYPHQFSGGMKQRAALIRTLALDPQLLLLDEPFSALDYQTRLMVSSDICQLIRKAGKTMIIVTHDLSEAISLADKVYVLSARPATTPGIGRATLDCRYTWSCNPRDVLSEAYRYLRGGLLPRLFTLTPAGRLFSVTLAIPSRISSR